MVASSLHPAFERAPAHHRWSGPLPELRAKLEAEAAKIAPRFAWRVLAHGACVAMQRLDDVLICRISRDVVPPRGSERKWDQGLATVRRELRLGRWEVEDAPGAVGVARLFRCPVALLCDQGCGREISERGQLFGGSTCDHCGL